MTAGIGQGGAFASQGTALPILRTVPQGAAASGGRWCADGGVKKAALGAAASHHALAGDRQDGRKRAHNGAAATRFVTPRGSRVVTCGGAESRGEPIGRVESLTWSGRQHRAADAVRTRRAVERVGSSDMLPRLNCPGISRGFEFSASYERRCRPAAEASAIGGSHVWSRWLGAGARAPEAKLDRVRNGLSRDLGIALGPTPGGGAHGVVPPSIAARGRADRHATMRRPLGFRAGESRWAAARGLHRIRGGWPIGSL